MYFSAFGYEISRRSRFELFARPHRQHHEIPVDHLPPALTVVRRHTTPAAPPRRMRSA